MNYKGLGLRTGYFGCFVLASPKGPTIPASYDVGFPVKELPA